MGIRKTVKTETRTLRKSVSDNPTNRTKKHLLDKAKGQNHSGLAGRFSDRNRGSLKGGPMKRSTKVITFAMALSATAMGPQALAQTQPANPGPPPAATPAPQPMQTPQQMQIQQKTQAPKQQNDHSRAKGAAAGAAIGAATGHAARGAVIGAGHSRRQQRRANRGQNPKE